MVNFLDKYKIISCTNEIAHVNVKVYFDCIYIVLVYSSRMKCFVILTEFFYSSSGKVRNNIPYQLNIPHQERSTNFFPDNTSPVSPINLTRTESSFGNSFRFHNRPSTSYDIHHTFSFSDKPRLQEQDSDGTSGIHTMEEIPSPFFSGNVV